MNHLNVRVAWHDNCWNGTVCKSPSDNSFCVDLDRIRLERNDTDEEKVAGTSFCNLRPDELPPCKAESAAFMNTEEWWREVRHPYQKNKKTSMTHSHLRPTKIRIPPYSTFAVPFNWMLRENQSRIDDMLPESLPPDENPPFPSPWVFSSERQEALSELFFNRLTPTKSLVFFYTKSGHPLGESIPRLVVGVGKIKQLKKIIRYESVGETTYPLWDRLFEHSIRPTGYDGFLLPYHDYLEPTGDPEEDARRQGLINKIAVVPERSQIKSFSYAGEHAPSDIALSTLVHCLVAVRKIREHGIAKGPWDRREEWINEQISRSWRDRGAFPGAGAALEALGMRLGTSLTMELMAQDLVGTLDDPWLVIDKILRGNMKPPQKVYYADIKAVSPTWARLSDERRSLLKLLSRFSLSTLQAKRWFDTHERKKATHSLVDDRSILENPYRIVETDLGDASEHPVSLGVIDRGLLPDATVSSALPVPDPSHVGSLLDWRRARAALVTVLRRAAENGDSLLSEEEALAELRALDLENPCVLTRDWLVGHANYLADEIESVRVLINSENDEEYDCLQLLDLRSRENRMARILAKRANKVVGSLDENWKDLLISAIKESSAVLDLDNPRHRHALEEQALALERITTRRLSAMVGRAGTGKTTVLGAFLKAKELHQGGVLFLAPTGKARVRLSQKTNATAMTVAQFLHHLGRFDGIRQRPLFEGNETYQKERTIVIDECSMLTLDDLYAVLMALDLAHVKRLILVGDPNQLPPIGVGRPFADLVAYLDQAAEDKEKAGGALARLSVEVRTTAGEPSDTLRLASWYTREPQPVDADRVISNLETGAEFNDLAIRFWESADDLRECLEAEFISTLQLSDTDDVEEFNRALGLTKEGWVPFDAYQDQDQGVENFQILSPVRMHPYGIYELNRWIQRRYRAKQLNSARRPGGLSLGDEEIVWGDKVIQLKNSKVEGWDGKKSIKVRDYLANGEIGLASLPAKSMRGKLLNISFANRPDIRFGYWKNRFSSESPPLELAYALTVHKAQGSEFGKVFVVLPKNTRLLSRELIYTALTRSRDKLVLLVEGKDMSFLYDLTRPEKSETIRRNTNLFKAGIRYGLEDVAYADHLVHRTDRGEMVRSKSELAIANYLYSHGLKNYQYERPLQGDVAPGKLRPDFSFIDDSGDVIIWEHLGMMDREDYRRGWEWKQEWYGKNDFHEGDNLFTTDEIGGLDTTKIAKVAAIIRDALEL